ncbi:MAG TPA: Dabb family protein [Candidatus Hydrogenedentes bacterium]|nr:Dabb family protein [Candidatus Hydrogenedentota bacterium]
MKRFVCCAVLGVLLASGCISVKGNVHVEEEEVAASAKIFRHVVFFKFKDGTSEADIAKVQRAFLDLKNGIETVRAIEAGHNVSTENLDQGYTHAFIVTFEDAAGRDTYLTHPVHDEFVKIAGPHLDKVCVIDFVPVH